MGYVKLHSASGYPRYGSVMESDEEFLAEGVVATVDEKDGTEVTFTWDRAVRSSDKGNNWSAVNAPANPLSISNGRAVEVPEYTVKAPQAAWDLLRSEVRVVTLLSSQPMPDGRRRLGFATLSGKQFGLDVEESASAEGLAALVSEARGFQTTAKIVQTDGSELPRGASVVELGIACATSS